MHRLVITANAGSTAPRGPLTPPRDYKPDVNIEYETDTDDGLDPDVLAAANATADNMLAALGVEPHEPEPAIKLAEADVLLADDSEPAADTHAADRLYTLLALFDTRDDTYIADLVGAARDGYEQATMSEADAWREFDALWAQTDSGGRLKRVGEWINAQARPQAHPPLRDSVFVPYDEGDRLNLIGFDTDEPATYEVTRAYPEDDGTYTYEVRRTTPEQRDPRIATLDALIRDNIVPAYASVYVPTGEGMHTRIERDGSVARHDPATLDAELTQHNEKAGRITTARDVLEGDDVLDTHGYRTATHDARKAESSNAYVLQFQHGVRYLHPDAPVRVRRTHNTQTVKAYDLRKGDEANDDGQYRAVLAAHDDGKYVTALIEHDDDDGTRTIERVLDREQDVRIKRTDAHGTQTVRAWRLVEGDSALDDTRYRTVLDVHDEAGLDVTVLLKHDDEGHAPIERTLPRDHLVRIKTRAPH